MNIIPPFFLNSIDIPANNGPCRGGIVIRTNDHYKNHHETGCAFLLSLSHFFDYIFEEIIFIMLLFLQGAAYCFILTLLSDLFIIVNAGFP